jgi:Subtilase family/FG-GAP-like repeat
MRSLLVFLLFGLPGARAVLPLGTYPECGTPDRPDLCPSELGEAWEMLSYVPEGARATTRPAELELGSGNNVDLAWRVTTGRFDVIMAIGDSGIDWSEVHLRYKVHINIGEVPLPQDADGVTAADYDTDGNGLVNVNDWVDDPRVTIDAGRDVADGILDASDLIYTFSDGVDDDGNGYADDIAGWDFFGHDNDAGHDYLHDYGTHGTGVAEEAGAEGEDGYGKIGVCPNCAILPVRVGDTFVTDGTRAGEAMVFAAESGAVAISQAIGALSTSDLTIDAARYAQDMGLTMIGAAGDENAYHHNFPAVLDGIIYVHSVRHNTPSEDGKVYSWFNTLNCNNFGARMTLVASSSACATGSVAQIVGVVGLMHSAARDAGLELSSAEVEQLLTSTADDVWLTDEERAESKAYPSGEGWDPFYGYGRVDAGAAVARVAALDIPPTVSLSEPSWFQTIDPADGVVDVVGVVSADRASSYTWEAEVGEGNDPRTWTAVGSGSGQSRMDGTLFQLDLSTFNNSRVAEADEDEGVVARLERVNGPAVTVRVRITDDQGRVGEQRRTFFVHRDDDAKPGFPFDLGGSGESSVVLADLDGDSIFEIIAGTGSGQVWALRGDGSALAGFPVATDPREIRNSTAEAYASGAVADNGDGFIGGMASGDLDGDGVPEIVGATLGGGLYAWHSDGSRVDGFPYWTIGREPEEFDTDHTWDQGFASGATLVDLDGDGALEIIAAAMDQRLYVVDADGNDFGPYPITLCYPTECDTNGARVITGATVGDLDGDGDYEIGLGSNEGIEDGRYSVSYLIDALTGEALPDWPLLTSGLVNEALLLPLVGEGHPASMAFADMDGDGESEIANPVMLGLTDPLNADQSTYLELPYYASDWPEGHNASMVPSIIQLVTNPAFGDLDGDGLPDYVCGGASALWLASLAVSQELDYQHGVGAWSGLTGEMFTGWPRQIEDIQFLMAPAIADVSGDGKPEVIYGSAGYLLHAWDVAGTEAAGWPKFTGNWLLGSPAVGDIDGDGYVDVVVTSREGWLYAWTTAGHADQAVQWQSLHHDAQNTGDYHHPLPKQQGPVLVADDESGCCKRDGGDEAWLLLPLGLFGLGRRRRSADRAQRSA